MESLLSIMDIASVPITMIGFVMLYQMQQKMFGIIDRMLDQQAKMNERMAHIETAQGIWQLQDENPTVR